MEVIGAGEGAQQSTIFFIFTIKNILLVLAGDL